MIDEQLHESKCTSPAVPSLLSDEEVASILTVSLEWVRSHASEIPGLQRFGKYYRFHPGSLIEWLGSLDPLLNSEQVAPRLKIPVSWVYANADRLPGVLRLGRYVRFRPTVFNEFIAASGACQ